MLRQAFPVSIDGNGLCGWCGGARLRRHALCTTCWRNLDQVDKNVYRELDIFGRAKWVVDNKPQVALLL